MHALYRRTLFLAFFAVGASAMAPPARAATFDTMNVMVTPGNVGFGVTITSVTAGVGYNFGSVNLGATTGSTAAISVPNSGVISENFVMSLSTSTAATSNSW